MRRIFYCNYYSKQPEVKALLDFSEHIQTLSELENRDSSEIEMEDTPAQSFCDDLMEQIRDKVKSDVNLTVNASNMSAKINKEYVSHILLHLLTNAAEYTPAGGSISLDFKKRQLLLRCTIAGAKVLINCKCYKMYFLECFAGRMVTWSQL